MTSSRADIWSILLVLMTVLAVYGLSFRARQPLPTGDLERTAAGETTPAGALTTLDAYHWMRMVRDMDAGKLESGTDRLRAYPDTEGYPEPNLLTRLIRLGSRFTDGDYYRAGLLLVPLLAGLFVFPLLLYGHTLGFRASAVLGGLVGSFGAAYYDRSAAGRVDTDLLNTFFPLAASALVALIGRERSFRFNLLAATGAGLAMNLFNAWYQQPAFFAAYLLFLTLHLALSRLPLRQSAGLLLAFVLASGPLQMLQSAASVRIFLQAYFFLKASGQVVWPDIMTTISEGQSAGLSATLDSLYGFRPLVLGGFTGLLYLYAARFRQMVPATPLILIGLWSLAGPRRFAMYLGPFVGLGAGVLIELLLAWAARRVKAPPLAHTAVAVALMLALFFSTADRSAWRRAPAPAVPAETVRALREIREIVPEHAPMFSWWDYGYPLMEIGGFATYHDGAAHGYARTTLVGKAFTSTRQEEIVSLLSFLEDEGFGGLTDRIEESTLSGDQLLRLVFHRAPELGEEKIHLLYTAHMIGQFRNISFFGTWDFDAGTSAPMAYGNLQCHSRSGAVIACQGATIDLERGVVSDGAFELLLSAVLFIDDGRVVDRRDYPDGRGEYLQILMRKGRPVMFLLADERLFRTNFNQQFLLGNYDRRFFEEVYNDFPEARVFRVKGTGRSGEVQVAEGVQ